MESLNNIINHIQPGDLIKGLHISSNGRSYLNKDRWIIDTPQDPIDQKRRNAFFEATNNCIPFAVYSDDSIKDLIYANRIQMYNKQNLKLHILERNGLEFYQQFLCKFDKKFIEINKVVGLSLGENFLALEPFMGDMYRDDFYCLYLFHKILDKDRICWIILQSTVPHRILYNDDVSHLILNSKMALV